MQREEGGPTGKEEGPAGEEEGSTGEEEGLTSKEGPTDEEAPIDQFTDEPITRK